jgi:hypothetical protein
MSRWAISFITTYWASVLLITGGVFLNEGVAASLIALGVGALCFCACLGIVWFANEEYKQ